MWLPKPGFEQFEPNLRGTGFWNVLGRLRPGVSITQARAEFDAVSAQLAREYPETNRNIAAQIVPLREHLVGTSATCCRCSSARRRSSHRRVRERREPAARARGRSCARVRRAAGARRGTRTPGPADAHRKLCPGDAGRAAGLVLARWTLDAISRLRPLDVARLDHIPIDARAAFIACGVTLVAAVAAGLTPSIQLSRPTAASVLREGRTSARRGVRTALVVVEVAAALVLAVSAGCSCAASCSCSASIPVSAATTSRRFRSSRRRASILRRSVSSSFEQALESMRALPGVVAAGGVSSMPFGAAKIVIRAPLTIDGRPSASGEQSQVNTSAVAGDYFRAMGVPLLKGRLFDPSDTATSRQVVLVSRNAAQQFWPGVDPIGSRVRFRFTGMNYEAEVVGVVGETRHEALDRPAAQSCSFPTRNPGFMR